MRIYCIAQGTLFKALWWPKGEGNFKKRMGVYIDMHGRFSFLKRENNTLVLKTI